MIDITCYPSPEASGATAVYAIGDIHGRLDLLNAMDAAVLTDIEKNQPLRPVICYLGDYIDRGPHSAQVIDRLCQKSADDIPRIYLKGNHEDRIIEFLEDPVANGFSWLKFGGREALESYGLSVSESLERTDLHQLRDRLSKLLPEHHLRFLRELRLAFVWGKFLFVHAGLNPARLATDQSARDLMWIREPFLSSDRDFGLRVVHGHVIVDEPEFRTNRIGIDTGAYQSGKLTCLVASTESIRLIQVIDT